MVGFIVSLGILVLLSLILCMRFVYALYQSSPKTKQQYHVNISFLNEIIGELRLYVQQKDWMVVPYGNTERQVFGGFIVQKDTNGGIAE